jgi:hypothetical protein
MAGEKRRGKADIPLFSNREKNACRRDVAVGDLGDWSHDSVVGCELAFRGLAPHGYWLAPHCGWGVNGGARLRDGSDLVRVSERLSYGGGAAGGQSCDEIREVICCMDRLN